MRIAILNHEFPPLGGGAATAAREIALGMAKRTHQVRVLTGAYGRLPRRELRDGYEIIRLPAFRHAVHEATHPEVFSFAILALPGALARIYRFRPDVCLAFFGVPAGIIACMARALWNVPYIVSLRGADVPGFAGVGPFTNLAQPLICLVWKQSSAVVANAPQLRQLALNTAALIDRDVMVIPNGVDVKRFQGSARRPHRGQIEALFVGRLAAQKGLDTLLQAIGLLAEETRTQLRLTVVGDGPLRARVEEKAAELNRMDVRFAGWQPRDKLPSIYAAADLLILPSVSEGMPNAVLEAMAAGLGVIATNAGGSPELVSEGENGMLVAPGSAPSLASALNSIIHQRALLAKWGTASRRLVESFTWDRVVEEYLSLAELARAATAEKPRGRS